MNKQRENSISLIGRVAMIGLFLFVILLFKNTDCSGKYFFSQTTPVPIEHVFDIDHSVILTSPASFPDYNYSNLTCGIFTYKPGTPNNFAILYSNRIVNQSLINCKRQFFVIKPLLVEVDSYHMRTSLSNGEAPVIS